ncbi:MAG: YdcF family protein [Chloroflexaceae bacterium]
MEPLKNIGNHNPCALPSGQGETVVRQTVARFWRSRLARGLAVLVCIVGIVMLTSGWWLPAIGQWLARPTRVAPVDAIVVLGGRYPYRDQHAIDLYHQGIGQEIWRTGPVELPAGRLVQRARNLAQEQGIPDEAYFVLESYSTWNDGEQIAALARERQTRSVLIVTDWAHSRRALCIISRHLAGSPVAVYYDHPHDLAIQPDNWWRDAYGREAVLSELGKMGLYALRYGTLPFGC